jgi:hypothetical protein
LESSKQFWYLDYLQCPQTQQIKEGRSKFSQNGNFVVTQSILTSNIINFFLFSLSSQKESEKQAHKEKEQKEKESNERERKEKEQNARNKIIKNKKREKKIKKKRLENQQTIRVK